MVPTVEQTGTLETMSRGRSAVAGAGAALAWAALEPLDRRLFRHDYSDVALLGKLVTRTRAWVPAGLALHAANGALFGLAFDALRRRSRMRAQPLALGLALVENFALFPLAGVVERHHPARGTPGLASIVNLRGLAQATVRHTVFGFALGRWAR
jgi:hypothetical protein